MEGPDLESLKHVTISNLESSELNAIVGKLPSKQEEIMQSALTNKSDLTSSSLTSNQLKASKSPRKTECSMKMSSRLPSRKSTDSIEKTEDSSSLLKSVVKSGTGESRHKAVHTQTSKTTTKTKDISLAGASSGPTTSSHDAAGRIGSVDMMDKKGSHCRTGGSGMKGSSDMREMMALMAKGGMPDMKAIMAKGGPHKSPLGMAKLFDCIIEVSLARADSDVSEDDDNSITIEIPCKYCSRFFTSQMSLKTHILVAHDHEDSSVLNLKKLVIDRKGKHIVKDHQISQHTHSHDAAKSTAAEASGTDIKLPGPKTTPVDSSSTQGLSTVEMERGMKRSRSCSKESSVDEISAAAGKKENYSSKRDLRSSARPETRKRKVCLRTERNAQGFRSGEGVLEASTKKSKSDDVHSDSSSGQSKESSSGPSQKTTATQDKSPDTQEKHKRVKAGIKGDHKSDVPNIASLKDKQKLKKDKSVVKCDKETGDNTHRDESGSNRRGRQSGDAAIVTSFAHGSDASTTRRNLRTRKTHLN